MDTSCTHSLATTEKIQILSICFMLALSLAITLGNVVSLSVFLGSQHFRSPQGYLKASLATADLAVGVLVIPYSVYNEIRALLAAQRGLVSGSSPRELELRGFSTCFLVGLIFAGCTLVSVFTIFLLSVERSITVLRPLHKNVLVTKGRTVALILVSWLFCFTLAVAPLLLIEDITLEYSRCSKMCNYSTTAGGWSVMLLFPAFDFSVLGATSLLNLLTFSAVRRFCRDRKNVCTPASRLHRGPTFSDLRAAKTILILTVLLSASVAPVAVLLVGNAVGFTWCHFSLYVFWILACSSAWNVLIYSARDRRFCLRVQELFLGWRRPRRGVRGTATTRTPTAGLNQVNHPGQCVAVFRQVPTTGPVVTLNVGLQE
ncbi:adenosine receptor A2a-like [Centroberyx gerrardi]|uniref:adenosine receptor A2a-like n=1 Tax=Centroberyx gerrardi TaxID=166262 RepID=UPI003AAF0B32